MPKPFEFGNLEAEAQHTATDSIPIDPPALSAPTKENAFPAPNADFERLNDLVDRASKAVAQSRLLVQESKLIVQNIRDERRVRSAVPPAQERDGNSEDFFPKD